MAKRGKRYRALESLYDRASHYAPSEAVSIVKQLSTAKFDETVELHIRTGLDTRHADQQLRGTARLPHGLGKAVRVAVFAEGEAARSAEQAGADVIGADDLIGRVQGRLYRLRCGDRTARADGQSGPPGAHPRAARTDAQPALGHRRGGR